MSIIAQEFRNCVNEPIWLKIEQFRVGNSQCRITIRRNCDIYQRFVLISLFLISTFAAYLWSNSTIVFSSVILTVLFSTLLLIYLQPVAEEILEVFDNFEGIQVSKRYLFSKKSSLPIFVNTNKIVINEAITMQRVIFCILAVPKNLHHLILESSGNIPGKVRRETKKVKLIPLFIHTLPRLDCLQAIYSQIYHFRTGSSFKNKTIDS